MLMGISHIKRKEWSSLRDVLEVQFEDLIFRLEWSKNLLWWLQTVSNISLIQIKQVKSCAPFQN